MPFAKRLFTPEQIAQARHLYEQTQTPLTDIAALLQVSGHTLRARVKEFGWRARNPKGRSFSPEQLLPSKADASAAKEKKETEGNAAGEIAQYPPIDRVARVARLERIVERQIDVIETLMAKMGAALPDDPERATRSLAVLHRTLQELLRQEPPGPTEGADDDDSVPCDLDELRRELSRRLAAIVARRADRVPGES
jgi:hypothetical protein